MNGVLISLGQADERLLRALVERRRPRIDALMRWVTRLGSWYVVVPLAVLLASGLLPAVTSAARVGLAALVTSHLLVQLLKRTVCRKRPELPVGMCSLIDPEDRFSFPSGHAASAMSVALPIFVVSSGPIAMLALLLGVSVGVSRSYLGVHHPGDVVVGWLLAIACTAAVAFSGLLG